MARAKTATPAAPSPYEQIGVRLQRIINSPGAQRTKTALLYKLPEEDDVDWKQVLEDIGEIDNVTVAHQDDGGVQVFWVVPKDD
jgi:hypothetical protein